MAAQNNECFQKGRTYRCVGPVTVWEVDRIASSGRCRSTNQSLEGGCEFVRGV